MLYLFEVDVVLKSGAGYNHKLWLIITFNRKMLKNYLNGLWIMTCNDFGVFIV